MKFLRRRELRIKEIALPVDMPSLDDPELEALGRSILIVGPVNEPIVRLVRGIFYLVTGRRRIAAHMLCRMTTAVCKICEFDSDEEAAAVAAADNNYTVPEEERGPAPIRISKRNFIVRCKMATRPPRNLELEYKARAEGVTVGAIRVREWRKRKKEQGIQPAKRQPIGTLGMLVDPTAIAAAELARVQITKALGKLATARVALERIHESDLPIPKPRIEALILSLKSDEDILRRLVPVSLCPNCKGIGAIQGECVACAATGFVGQHLLDAAPKKLKDEDDPVVTYRGQAMSVAEFGTPEQLPHTGVGHHTSEPELPVAVTVEDEEELNALFGL